MTWTTLSYCWRLHVIWGSSIRIEASCKTLSTNSGIFQSCVGQMYKTETQQSIVALQDIRQVAEICVICQEPLQGMYHNCGAVIAYAAHVCDRPWNGLSVKNAWAVAITCPLCRGSFRVIKFTKSWPNYKNRCKHYSSETPAYRNALLIKQQCNIRRNERRKRSKPEKYAPQPSPKVEIIYIFQQNDQDVRTGNKPT